MTVINGDVLLKAAPIKNMLPYKGQQNGVSFGLSEAGYDIRVKQEIRFNPSNMGPIIYRTETLPTGEALSMNDVAFYDYGRFAIASAMEEFEMPNDLVGIVHDKSTWARQGISVFNTVIEPGWKGFLTLEIVFHGSKEIIIPAGSGIAQVIFSSLADVAYYEGKYQDQKDKPVSAIMSGSYGDMGVPGDNHYDHSKRGFRPK